MKVNITISENLLALHCRALCAHAECLGLNSANFYCIVKNDAPCYSDETFSQVLMKWGLIDEKGEPTF